MKNPFKRINENLKYINKGNAPQAIDSEVDGLLNDANMQQLVQFIASLKNINADRESLIADYENMSKDSLVGSGIELMAEDATQEDDINHRICWAVAKEVKDGTAVAIDTDTKVNSKKQEKIINSLNTMLTDLDIDSHLWTYAYNIVKYGEMFLNTYDAETSGKDSEIPVDKDLKKKRGYLFDIVQNPSQVSDLLKYGDTVGYSLKMKDSGIKIYDKKQFIHFVNDRGCKREEVSYKYVDKKLNKEVENVFQVKVGTSYLETARQAFLILDLCEEIILAVRFGRSAVYRMFKVEVGSASKVETNKILNEFKRRLSSQESMNLKERTYTSSNKPLPYGSNVYVPVRSGKGDVQQELVGGDVDFKDMVDVEYFRNKLFAALKIPKAFLGFEEAMPGGIGNQSLTRIDIRYARSIRRIKTILKSGIKEMLCYHYYAINGEELDPNLFDIKMAEIMTADEGDKREDTINRVQLAESLKGLCADAQGIDQKKLIQYLVDTIIGVNGMYKEIEGENTETDNQKEKEKDDSGFGW